VPRILVVDDDPSIRDVIRFALERAGFGVTEAADGQAAIAAYSREQHDLVVLDVMMPELDGHEVCRVLRRTSPVPILFLSSRDEEIDRIVGLEIGADDYLVKPFSPRELVARIKAILRRANGVAAVAEAQARPAEPSVFRYGLLTLDLDEISVSWSDQPVNLTATEFGILRTLIRHPGRVFTRDSLMDGAYAVEKTVSDRTIDSHVRRLRAKFAAIGAAPVETLQGFGYRLGPCR